MLNQVDTPTSVQPFPTAHLFMQYALFLGADMPLRHAWKWTYYDAEHNLYGAIHLLEEINQAQLPERAQSIVESEANLHGWQMCGRAQVDEALYHLEEWPQHQDSTLEWIEIYCREWYNMTAHLLGEWCPATATSFYAGVTDAMIELL